MGRRVTPWDIYVSIRPGVSKSVRLRYEILLPDVYSMPQPCPTIIGDDRRWLSRHPRWMCPVHGEFRIDAALKAAVAIMADLLDEAP